MKNQIICVSKLHGVLIKNENSNVLLEFLLQPIYNAKTSKVIYYEFLSKVIEGEFLLDNEEFFQNLDDEIIKHVCVQQVLYAKNNDIDKMVAVNITLSCLEDDDFVMNLSLLCDVEFALEINEINHIHLNERVISNIEFLRSKGVSFWLDDFYSTSNSSILTLGVIQWDYIKIDKSFLWNNYKDSSSIISINKVLNDYASFGLIFEGVETEMHEAVVKSVGALAQGFLYSYPKKWNELQKEKNADGFLNVCNSSDL